METLSQSNQFAVITFIIYCICFVCFKVLFKDRFLGHFIAILLQTLIYKTHALLTDEVQVAVYNMASVHFDFFFNTVLQRLVSTVDGVAAEQWNVLIRNFVHYHDKVMKNCFSFNNSFF